MPSSFRRSAHHYELLPRTSLDSGDFQESTDGRKQVNPSWLSRRLRHLSAFITPRRRKRSILRLAYWSIFIVPYFIIFLVLFVAIFFPSYTSLPAHYRELQRLATRSLTPGRANVHNEKVFIAASLYEVGGELTSGAWGQSVLELVDLLGPQNVYLSIYENDADEATQQSLLEFKQKTTCNSTILSEDLDLATLPHVSLPNGEKRLKRIAFLAEVRNRALAPIDEVGIQFDRVLYINDVNFKPIEAAQLLFSTNVDETGRANYGAACAVDFINPFKFYDRFATRDLNGYSMGIPFYPWFTSAGNATSRNDVLANSDAVRVRSCWGGMTAFEAKWFQDQSRLPTPAPTSPNPASKTDFSPLRFRYETYTFWDSSECCLINADLQYRRTGQGMPADSGIYMNPYIRVAYDTRTLSWLSLSRRPERLYSFIHNMLNNWVGFPYANERQYEEPGKEYTDTMWEYDHPEKAFSPNATSEDFAGHWAEKKHIATPGGYCGGRNLLVINETPEQGEGKWGKVPYPLPPS